MSTTYTSTLDEDLMKELGKHLEQAGELAGIKKPKAKATGPRVFEYPAGYKPVMSVLPISRVEFNVPIRVFNKEDWPEEMRKFIPEVDDYYVFDPEATLAVVVEMYSTKEAKHIGPMLLHGPKGSGKTTLPQQICARINMPYIRVNCKQDMESAALFGSVKYDPINGMGWVDGPLAELAKVGGTLCIDEVSRMPSGIAASLMGAMEKNPTVYLADKPGSSDEKLIKPAAWFRIVCTDNTELQGDTTGKYVGTNVQDEALIDRFDTTYKLGYLLPAHEVAIITGKVKAVDAHLAARMVQLAQLIRSSYDSGNIGFTMSPRGLLCWAEKYAFWEDEGKSFKLAFFNKLTTTDRQVVAEFFHTVFAVNLR